MTGGPEYEGILDRVAGAVCCVLGGGSVPDQIPAPADADPRASGLAVATGEGEVHGVSRSDAKRINAVMLPCGTYDAAGEFAYRVGVPAKSGVAGGILAIIPGRCGLCVWSPGLDDKGNWVAGIAALDAFTTLTGWSVF